MTNPICRCGEESTWIDNGPRLQYHYCRDCKVEVSESVTDGLDFVHVDLGSFTSNGGTCPPPPSLPPIAPVTFSPGMSSPGTALGVPIPPFTSSTQASSRILRDLNASYSVTVVDYGRQEVYLQAAITNVTRIVPLKDLAYILPLSKPGDRILGYDFSQYPEYRSASSATLAQHQFNPNTGSCDACGASMYAGVGPGCPGATPNPSATTAVATMPPNRCPALTSGNCNYIPWTNGYTKCTVCNSFKTNTLPIYPVPQKAGTTSAFEEAFFSTYRYRGLLGGLDLQRLQKEINEQYRKAIKTEETS